VVPAQSRPKLSPEEQAITLAIAESIASLEQSEGWAHFTKAAEALITQNTPNITTFTTDEATAIASKMTFISGIKACLGLVKANKKRAADLRPKPQE
jgi:hypothetical protein